MIGDIDLNRFDWSKVYDRVLIGDDFENSKMAQKIAAAMAINLNQVLRGRMRKLACFILRCASRGVYGVPSTKCLFFAD